MEAADSPLTPEITHTAAYNVTPPWAALPSAPGWQLDALPDAQTHFKDLSALLLMVSITVLALLSNTAVLAAIVRAPHLRKFAFVCHLCAVDLLCAALLMPLGIASRSPFSAGLAPTVPECQAYVFLNVSLAAASIFTVTAISVERYYYIVHPMRYEAKMTLRLAAAVVAAVWAASALLGSAAVSGWPARGGGGGPRPVGAAARCSLRRSRRGFSVLFGATCFCVPAAVMFAVYCSVYKVARVAARQRGPLPSSWSAGQPKRRSDSVSSRTVIITTRNAPPRGPARDKASGGGGKAALTLVVIVGQFLLCWLPYFAYHLHLALAASPAGAADAEAAEAAVTWLAYSSFAANPFFYGLLNRQIREELWRLRRCYQARPAEMAAASSQDGSAHDHFLHFLQRSGSAAEETRASLDAPSPRSTLDQTGQAGLRIPGQIPEELS